MLRELRGRISLDKAPAIAAIKDVVKTLRTEFNSSNLGLKSARLNLLQAFGLGDLVAAKRKLAELRNEIVKTYEPLNKLTTERDQLQSKISAGGLSLGMQALLNARLARFPTDISHARQAVNTPAVAQLKDQYNTLAASLGTYQDKLRKTITAEKDLARAQHEQLNTGKYQNIATEVDRNARWAALRARLQQYAADKTGGMLPNPVRAAAFALWQKQNQEQKQIEIAAANELRNAGKSAAKSRSDAWSLIEQQQRTERAGLKKLTEAEVKQYLGSLTTRPAIGRSLVDGLAVRLSNLKYQYARGGMGGVLAGVQGGLPNALSMIAGGIGGGGLGMLGGALGPAGAALGMVIDRVLSKLRDVFAFVAEQLGTLMQRGRDLQSLHAQTGIRPGTGAVWQRTAEMAGIDPNAMGLWINRFQANLSGVDPMTPMVQHALARLRISVYDLRQLKPEDQLNRIMVGLANIKDPAQRAAIAVDLMNRNGGEMLRIFNNPQLLEEAKDQLGELPQFFQRNTNELAFMGRAIDGLKLKLQQFFAGFGENFIGMGTSIANVFNKIDLTKLGKIASLQFQAITMQLRPLFWLYDKILGKNIAKPGEGEPGANYNNLISLDRFMPHIGEDSGGRVGLFAHGNFNPAMMGMQFQEQVARNTARLVEIAEMNMQGRATGAMPQFAMPWGG